jgi:hypothetical protein
MAERDGIYDYAHYMIDVIITRTAPLLTESTEFLLTENDEYFITE